MKDAQKIDGAILLQKDRRIAELEAQVGDLKVTRKRLRRKIRSLSKKLKAQETVEAVEAVEVQEAVEAVEVQEVKKSWLGLWVLSCVVAGLAIGGSLALDIDLVQVVRQAIGS